VIQYIENLMIWIQKQDKFIVIIWKKMESEVNYRDKTMTNSISHGKLKDEIHGCMDSKS
jgi:hypothetical protein